MTSPTVEELFEKPKDMKSEYISRPTVQKMTGLSKEGLIDLLERWSCAVHIELNRQ